MKVLFCLYNRALHRGYLGGSTALANPLCSLFGFLAIRSQPLWTQEAYWVKMNGFLTVELKLGRWWWRSWCQWRLVRLRILEMDFFCFHSRFKVSVMFSFHIWFQSCPCDWVHDVCALFLLIYENRTTVHYFSKHVWMLVGGNYLATYISSQCVVNFREGVRYSESACISSEVLSEYEWHN